VRHIHLHDIRPGFVRTPLLSDGGRYPMQLKVDEVAHEIVRGIERNKFVITVDWKYRILVAFWKLIPNWLWVRLRIVSK
jgi:short-subunit dehydrogenase